MFLLYVFCSIGGAILTNIGQSNSPGIAFHGDMERLAYACAVAEPLRRMALL